MRVPTVLMLPAVVSGCALPRGRPDAKERVEHARPDARNGHRMADDESRGVVVLFGGRSAAGVALSDTWEWDGRAWSEVSRAGPPARDHHAAAFDAKNAVALIHGGFNGNRVFGDTWTWNGSTWTQASDTGPRPRAAHVMTYDAARGFTVMFGGLELPEQVLSDTWIWDGRTWVELPNAAGAGRTHLAMAYDPRCHCVVRFGGKDASRTALQDTWQLVDDRWQTPQPCNDGVLGYVGNDRLGLDTTMTNRLRRRRLTCAAPDKGVSEWGLRRQTMRCPCR